MVFAPTGRAVGDHVFWPFHARSELTAVAQAFVVEGLADGSGSSRRSGAPLRHDLAGVPDLEDCLDRGQLRTDIATRPPGRLSDPVDELIDPAMTRTSLDAGYTGLRWSATGPCG